MAFLTSVQDFFYFFQQLITKMINSKVICSQSPSFLVLRPRGLREEERAMDTRKTRFQHVPVQRNIERKSPSLCKVRMQGSQDDEGTLLDTYKSLFT